MELSDRRPVVSTALDWTMPKISRWRRISRLIRDNPMGMIGLSIVVVLVFVALLAPVIAPYPPDELAVGPKLLDPSMKHPFGTDGLGRDMFSRVVYGARISLMVGLLAVGFGTLAGTVFGIVTGYVGGVIDAIISRIVDMMIAFPALLLLLILRQVMGASIQTLILAIGIAIIPGVTRVVRGEVVSQRNNQYVEAAIVLGASTPRILFFHIAPNVVALAIVVMTSLLGTAVLAEASLSFLGLGIPSTVTWGGDVNAARLNFPVHIAWAFFPGAAIALTVLGFSLFGDSLRDIFDPRLRSQR
jgi:ABC-type dipeptide/oligopeptide/nickel transport system permease subunit